MLLQFIVQYGPLSSDKTAKLYTKWTRTDCILLCVQPNRANSWVIKVSTDLQPNIYLYLQVRFYMAGGPQHGAIYAVSPQRFTSFDNLLAKLTKTPLCTKTTAQGANFIFSLTGAHKITSLDELESGRTVRAARDECTQLCYRWELCLRHTWGVRSDCWC